MESSARRWQSNEAHTLLRVFNAWKNRAMPKELRDYDILEAQNLALSLAIKRYENYRPVAGCVPYYIRRQDVEEAYFRKYLWQGPRPSFSDEVWKRVEDAWTRANQEAYSLCYDDFGSYVQKLLHPILGYPVQVVWNWASRAACKLVDLRIRVSENSPAHKITYGIVKRALWEHHRCLDYDSLHLGQFHSGDETRWERFELHEGDATIIGELLQVENVLEANYFPGHR
ncbi:unnamed protein product [Symbiodinium natans]|uniref:Uncharacterized protein n=1 Tax=Symbiodinium natans TaxID=878477 RepID=A0A812KKG7_9DINO|nr:unnamed protein product [Symbiodinium natans]